MTAQALVPVTFETYQPSNADHQAYAAALGAWSAAAGSMLPLTPERMEGFRYSRLALDPESRQPLGHVAVTRVENGAGLIGGLVVSPFRRRQQIGRRLVEDVLKTAPDAVPDMEVCRAYAHAASRELFTSLGGVVLPDRRRAEATGCVYEIDLTGPLRDIPLPVDSDTHLV